MARRDSGEKAKKNISRRTEDLFCVVFCCSVFLHANASQSRAGRTMLLLRNGAKRTNHAWRRAVRKGDCGRAREAEEVFRISLA